MRKTLILVVVLFSLCSVEAIICNPNLPRGCPSTTKDLTIVNLTIVNSGSGSNESIFSNNSQNVFIKEGYPKNLKIDGLLNSTNLFVSGYLECPQRPQKVDLQFKKVTSGPVTFSCYPDEEFALNYEVFSMKTINGIDTFSSSGTTNYTIYKCGSSEYDDILVNVTWTPVSGIDKYYVVNHLFDRYRISSKNFLLDEGDIFWIIGAPAYTGFSPTCSYNNTIYLNGKLVAGGVIVGKQEIMMDNVRTFLAIPNKKIVNVGNNTLNVDKNNFVMIGYDNGNENFSSINDAIIIGKDNFKRLQEGSLGVDGENYIAIGENIEANNRRMPSNQIRIGFNIKDLITSDGNIFSSNIIGTSTMRNATGGAINILGSYVMNNFPLEIGSSSSVNILGTFVHQSARKVDYVGGVGSYVYNLVEGENVYWLGDTIYPLSNKTYNAMGFGRAAIIPSNNSVVFGSATSPFRDFYLGAGRNISSANFNVTIHSTGGGGSTSRGANLYLRAGSGTGTAEPSWIGFMVSNRTSSSSVEQPSYEVMRISTDGVIIDYRSTGNNNAIPLTLFSPRGGNQSIALRVHGNITLNGSLVFFSEVWDKRKGSALDYLQSTTNCVNSQGKLISHDCFGDARVYIKDVKQTGTRTIPQEIKECVKKVEMKQVKTKNKIYFEPIEKEECINKTIIQTEPIYEQVTYEGYDFEKDYAMLREAVVELKLYKEKNERCLSQSNNFVEYKNCMR